MTVEDQVRLYAEAITADAPARIARVIDKVADPLALEERTLTADHAAVTVASPGRSGRGPRRPSRAVWWVATAAAVVVLAAVGVATLRQQPADRSVQTPDGKVKPDSYPDPRLECGGDRVTDAVALAGPASADSCIGLPAADAEGPQAVYVTSRDGARILGGWVLSECPDFTSGGSAQLETGNDDGPILMYGMAEPSVAAVQYELADGTTLTAETLAINGIDQAVFYAVALPANPSIVDRRNLDTSGAEVNSPAPGCIPQSVTLPDEVASAIAKGLITETSTAMGVEVGDPCSDTTPTSGGLPMTALIAGNVTDDTCHIIGWSAIDVPGIPTSTQFDQDGNITYKSPPPPPGPDDPGDGLPHGPAEATP